MNKFLLKSVTLFLLVITLLAGKQPVQAQNQTVLTIILRTSLGEPLEGVEAEVLSYDWGMPMGQPYAIIARGETDKNGVMAFDNSKWPFSGYRVKFTPTNHTKPTNAYCLPDDQNQYRGYPGISTGGVTETQKFVLSGSDGLIYNDLSSDGELPQYQRDPVGGMLNPRVSVMPGQDFVATALAATRTAEARGEPTPTFPPPPAASPRPGEVEAPLTITPVAKNPALAPATTQAAPTTDVVGAVVTAVVTSPPPVTNPLPSAAASTPTARATQASAPSATRATDQPVSQPSKSGTDLLGSILLAVAGIAALAAFWKFRFKIYALLGIEVAPKNRPTKQINRAKQPAKPKTGKK